MNWAKNTFGIQSRSTATFNQFETFSWGNFLTGEISSGSRNKINNNSSPPKTFNAYYSSTNRSESKVGVDSRIGAATSHIAIEVIGLSVGGSYTHESITYAGNYTNNIITSTYTLTVSTVDENGVITENYYSATINHLTVAVCAVGYGAAASAII